MKNCLSVFFTSIILVHLFGCATTKIPPRAKGPSDSEGVSQSRERPKWVTEPGEACPHVDLCAVGEGTGHMGAEAAARNSLGKIFETRVKSNTKIISTSSQETDSDGVISGSTDQSMNRSIEEISNELLKGVQIKAKWEDPKEGTVFALATLRRSEGAQLFKKEMDELDEKIVDFYKSGRRAELNKALRILEFRSGLNTRYQILSNAPYPEKVSLSQIMAKKRSKPALKVSVNFKGEEQFKELRSLVGKLLIENDYQVVSSGKEDFLVEANLEQEDMHINVKGFEKYKFILNIRSLNKSGQKVGALGHTEEQVGRGVAQAYENAMPGFRKFLKENLGELNMD